MSQSHVGFVMIIDKKRVRRGCGLSHQKPRESLTGVQFDPFENPSESLTKPQFDPFENPSESLTKLQIDPFSKLWESLTERNPSESLTIPEPTPQRKASRFEHATRNRSPFAPNRVYGCEVQQLVSTTPCVTCRCCHRANMHCRRASEC